MAVNLSMFRPPRDDRPRMFTIYGEGGRGKTTLAALFPKPIFILTEDGTVALEWHGDYVATDVLESSDDVIKAIDQVMTGDHDRKTLVIDDVTRLNTIIEEEVTKASGAKSINLANGGFKGGYLAAARKHREIRAKCEKLMKARNMNIVFIGHAKTETVKPPDGSDYTRYTLRMHEEAAATYIEMVDCVAFVRLKSYTASAAKGDDKKIVVSQDEIEIVCTARDDNVSKNRMHIDTVLPFNIGAGNPFAPYLKG